VNYFGGPELLLLLVGIIIIIALVEGFSVDEAKAGQRPALVH
jgi:hypothetical protein